MLARTKDGKINYKKIIIESGLYLVLFCMLIAIIIKEPTFLSIRNFKNILTQSSVRSIIALGVAGLIVTQGTDLSAGRQVGLSAVISATLLQSITNVNKAFPQLGEFSLFTTILIVVAGMNAHSNSGAAYSPHASSASAGSAHLSAGSGAGIGSTTSPKTTMPLQTPVAPINSTGSSGVITPTSAGTTGGAGRMAGVPLGGVPMTGAGHNQHQAKQKARHQIHKVQSLTAQYERDLNLRELLGEPPKVIPGVISSWVRNPRYKWWGN